MAKTKDEQGAQMLKFWGASCAVVTLVLSSLAVGWSAPAGADTPGAPGAPSGVVATPANGQLSITWTPPADPGTSAIASYVATAANTSSPGTNGDGNTCPYVVPTDGSAEIDTCVITGLTGGNSYTVTVVTTNKSGQGILSDPSNPATPGTAPHAPTGVTARAGDSSVTVSWTAPENGTAAEVTGYVATAGNEVSTCAVDATQNSCVITGLANGTSTTVAVVAQNTYGVGASSSPSSPFTPAAVPGAPRNVTSTSGDGTAMVSWIAPSDNGGSPILGYSATASNGTSSCSTATTSCQITGLTDGTAYTFSVVATNAMGPGSSATDWTGATPAAVPGVPTSVTATPAHGQAVVSWTAPASDGGSAITGYTVTSSEGSHGCTTATTSCIVMGLADGVGVTFSVTATNATGSGDTSDPSTSVTPIGLPGVPTGVSATTADSQANVFWSAPTNTGGSSITGYIVTASDSTSSCSIADGVSTSCTVVGLIDGTSYTFTVTATNAAGTSSASAPSSSVTPLAPPGPPTGLSVTPHNQRVDVSWGAPSSTGGSPITGYTVTASNGTSSCSAASTSCTVTGLTNGTAYTFTVVAISAVGAGPASTSSTSAIPTQTVPGDPTNVTATSLNDGQVTVSWQAPADNGGSTITGYWVNWGMCTTTGATTCTLTDQVGGWSRYLVQAINRLGASSTSATSAMSNIVTDLGIPGPPLQAVVQMDGSLAKISWLPPSQTGGSPVLSYTARDSTGGSCTYLVVNPESDMCSISGSGFPPGVTFTVVATNAQGNSPAALASTSARVTAPTAPSAVVASGAGDGAIAVSWSPSSNNGGDPGISYLVSESIHGKSCTASTTNTCTLAGLQDGVVYGPFSVVAVNSGGTSNAAVATPTVVTALGPPGPPISAYVSVSGSTASLSWIPPTRNGGSAVLTYIASDGNGATCTYVVATPQSNTCSMTGPGVSSSDNFSVVATNAQGRGPAATASTTTPSTIPGPPTGVAATANPDGSVSVTWSPPTDDGGSPVTSYAVSNAGILYVWANRCSASTQTTCRVTGLSPGLPVSLSVWAINANGVSSSSAATFPVVPISPPLDQPGGGAVFSGTLRYGGSNSWCASGSDRVVLTGAPGTFTQTVGSDGTFSLSVPRAVYQMSVQARPWVTCTGPSGYSPEVMNITMGTDGIDLTGAGMTGVSLTLPPPVNQAVRVTDTRGVPVAGASVLPLPTLGADGTCSFLDPSSFAGLPGLPDQASSYASMHDTDFSSWGLTATVTTDANGIALIPLPACDLELAAAVGLGIPVGVTPPSNSGLTATQMLLTSVLPGGITTVVLARPAHFTGHLSDPSLGIPCGPPTDKLELSGDPGTFDQQVDGSGNFSFTVPPATYRLTVSQARPWICTDHSSGGGGTTMQLVTDGIDLTSGDLSGQQLAFPVSTSITGTVTDGAGAPVAGATVSGTEALGSACLAMDPSAFSLLPGTPVASSSSSSNSSSWYFLLSTMQTKTDAQGQFSLAVPPCNQFSPSADLLVTPPSGSQLAPTTAVAVNATGAGRNISVVLPRKSTFAGTVSYGNGTSVCGNAFYDGITLVGDAVNYPAEIGPDGTFSVSVPQGVYRMYLNVMTGLCDAGGGLPRTLVFNLTTSGIDLRSGDLTSQRLVLPSPDALMVGVYDGSTHPVAGAVVSVGNVHCTALPPEAFIGLPGRPGTSIYDIPQNWTTPTATTDSGGMAAFQLPDCLQFSDVDGHPGMSVTATPSLGSAVAAAQVRFPGSLLPSTPSTTIVLPTIAGTIADASGFPLVGQSVVVQNALGAVVDQATTSGAGSFQLNATPGTYDVTVSGAVGDPNTYAVTAHSVSLNQSSASNLTIPTEAVTLNVTGPGGVPVGGATVQVACTAASFSLLGGTASGSQCLKEYTSASGQAVLTLLPTSSVSVSIIPPAGSALQAQTISIAPANGATVNVGLIAKPGAPTGVSATTGNGSATVSWTAPASTGGSTITNYTVTASPGGETCSTASTSCLVSGLTNGIAYTFRVRATNSAGAGSFSSASSAVTPATTPGVPQGFRTTAGDHQMTLTWAAPASSGGSSITGYVVTRSPSGTGCITTLTTTCVVTGLTDGMTYTFTLSAHSAKGTGPTTTVTATPVAVPGAPTQVHATRGNGQLAVSWTAPATSGGTTVTGYTATASPGGSSCATTATSCAVTGLANGTSYSITVTARSQTGTSIPSAASSATPATTPGAPTSITAAASNNEVTLSWTAPASTGGSAITGYFAHANPGGQTCSTTTTSCVITGLTSGAAYSFTVVAINAVNPGSAGTTTSTTKPLPVPDAPTGVHATPGIAQAQVSWTAPTRNGGSAISRYRVTSTPGSKFCSTTGATSCIVVGLTNGQTYTFAVVAVNDSGTGPASTPSATVIAGASAPQITSANHITFTKGSSGTFTMTATGYPAPTFTVTAGTLPTGVTLNGTTGVLSGTPAADAAATCVVIITASNGVSPAASQSLTITVVTPPPTSLTVTTASLPAGSLYSKTHKVLYSAILAATAGNAPYKWSLISGTLPAGLNLKPTGVISGKATITGTFTFTVRVIDTKTKAKHPIQHTATRVLSITVSS